MATPPLLAPIVDDRRMVTVPWSVFFAGTSPSLLTVAQLVMLGTATGQTAIVKDGDSGLAWGATVVNTGAGATTYLVWHNGTAWTVIGK